MVFKDKQHEAFYKHNIEKTGSHKDPYRKALFYTLGLMEETRNNIDTLYDYKERGIKFEGLNMAWQTGTSKRLTRLAFNLYNGYSGDTENESISDDSQNYTPYYLFDNSLAFYMLEAIKVRYPEYLMSSKNEPED